MSKVTSKLQVTIPKAIADKYSIAPGDEIEWIPGVDSVRIISTKTLKPRAASTATRLRLFEAASQRQREREQIAPRADMGAERGWTREELYERGSSR